MKASYLIKTLGLVAITSLTAATGVAQADQTYVGVRFGPGNPYLAASYGGPGPYPGHYSGHHRDHRHDRHAHGWVDSRQERQLDRIELGVARGEITKREAAKLYHEQREIERMQRHFMADGHLSRGEYANLDEALDRAGRNIRHQANDNEWRW